MADAVNQELGEQEEDTQQGKFLIFLLDRESYGVAIVHVTEIIGIHPITEVPDLPDYVRGIINLRGKIIPVIDVRLRFKKPLCEYNDRTCIIVVDIMDTMVGLIVDCVSEVLTIREENIVLPHELKAAQNRFINGIGKVGTEIKLLLDCERLLDWREFDPQHVHSQEGSS